MNKRMRRFLRGGATLILLLVAPRVASGHDHTPPWLDEQVLDNGLYVAVHHPRIIRASGPFDVRVSIRNLAGGGDVTVETIRYAISGNEQAAIHRVDKRLTTKQDLFARYQVLSSNLHARAEIADISGVNHHTAEHRQLLSQLSRDVVSDRFRVPASQIEGMLGSAIEMLVEIDLVEDGIGRTIRRDVRIPISEPLPNRAARSPSWAFDVRTGELKAVNTRAISHSESNAATWYAGDQHLHTTYSLDAFAIDGTVEDVTDYAAAAELVDLDWIIITDHSNVHVNWSGTEYYTPGQFTAGAAQAAAYSSQNSLLALYGQEMGAGQAGLFSLPSHYLAYPFATDSTGYIDNPSSGLLFGLANCEPEQTIIDRVNAAGGFGFIAHPFDSGSLAFAEWDFEKGATGWSGLEIWSDDSGQIKITDDEAQSRWYDLLSAIPAPQMGELAERPGFPNAFPVGIGNSDAHQSGLIGATFTYAWMPSTSRGDVVSALSEGKCVASNGPLLTGQINGARIGQMAFLLDGDNDLDLALTTTAEFGAVGEYTLTVLVNGVVSATVPPTGDPGFSMAVVLGNMDLSPPDKFVTLRADSGDGVFHALSNPIWLQFAEAGDSDADGQVTMVDLARFTECLTGPGITRDPSCDVIDLDRDEDVDLADFSRFQKIFSGT